MKKKLLLVDAYALIYRSYFAFIRNPLVNSQGVNTAPMVGFCRVMDEVIASEQPDNVIVAFDGSVRPFRFKIYDQYKAQREKTPEDILLAVPVIKRILDAYCIQWVDCNHSPYDSGDEHYSYEADDIIGTLSVKAVEAGYSVVMLTPDKDYAQLVNSDVNMLRPKSGGGYEFYDLPRVLSEWKISDPRQMIDFLALAGDKSDNIPGCAGVGDVRAVQLIEQFGSVEGLLSRTAELKGKLKDNVEKSAGDIRLSYTLAQIALDAPVDFDQEASRLKKENTEELIKIFNEYEMKSLVKRHSPSQAPSAEKKEGTQLSLFENSVDSGSVEFKYENLGDINSTDHVYKLIENEDEIDDLVAKISAMKIFCFDTETTSTNTFCAELVGMSFSWKEGEAFFVLLPGDREQAQKVVDKFKPVFSDEKIAKVGQNLKFDIMMLSHYGVEVRGRMFDTMIAHYLLQPEQRHGMDYLAESYLRYKTVTYEEMTAGGGSKSLPIRMVDKNRLADYAAEDADVTFKLYNVFAPLLKDQGLEKLFSDVEMPLMSVLVKMELAGVRLDVPYLGRLSAAMNSRLKEIEQEIYDGAGYVFNISSPRQVGELIVDRLHLIEKPKKTKTGQYSTTEAVLDSLRGKSPVVDKILDYRALKKLISTYVDALPKLVDEKTGKVHTSFNQAVTSTGRLSSSDPNLQNIPVRDDLGKDIRKAFVPDDGCVFLSSDYSQIELRVLAHMSGDENLIADFKSGKDVHAATAAKIFGVPVDEVTKDMRRKAKTANFGIIYGISAFGLAQRLDVPREEARQLIDGYYASYPGVKKFIEGSIEKVRGCGYAETLFHRRRFLPDINSRNANVRGFAERNAVNAPIQGTAADIIKIAMVNIMRRFEKEGIKSEMITQVHDELNFSVLPDELDRVKQIVVDEMEHAVELKVPLEVDCRSGENWLEAH